MLLLVAETRSLLYAFLHYIQPSVYLKYPHFISGVLSLNLEGAWPFPCTMSVVVMFLLFNGRTIYRILPFGLSSDVSLEYRVYVSYGVGRWPSRLVQAPSEDEVAFNCEGV